METVKKLVRGRAAAVPAEVEERLSALEAEVQECRQLNLRLAELCDVMMELLLPAAGRDDAAVQEILERYKADMGDPLTWRR